MMEKNSESEEVEGTTNEHIIYIKFLEMINEKVTQYNEHMKEEIRFLRDTNALLLGKLLNKNSVPAPVNETEEFNPVGGYIPLRKRIENAEEESRKKFEAENAETKEEI